MRVIVVGAGLGGLTLAHGLRRAGIDVVVHERDGQRGRPRNSRGSSDVPTAPSGRTSPTAAPTPADRELADVLVGADGIGSAVRRRYPPDVRVIDTGERMLMGATPLRALDGTELPTLIGHNPASVRVRGTTMALGVLRFAEGPVVARERWLPTLPFRAVAGVEDYVMWAMPVTGERPGSAEPPAAVWGRAKELAAGLPPALRTVVDRAWPPVTAALRIGMIPRPPRWPAAAVTVIGDAIHLAPGFGGNLVMRDAQRLRDALVRAATGEQGLLTAIGAYEDALRRDGFPTADALGPRGAATGRASA